MEAKEQEFYCILKDTIDIDMAKEGLRVDDLKERRYVISRQTYFNIKSLSEGSKTAYRLSHTKMLHVCKHLGIEIKDIKFIYKKSKK
jgi:hypothetical protein